MVRVLREGKLFGVGKVEGRGGKDRYERKVS
jgi:hypothetical protein